MKIENKLIQRHGLLGAQPMAFRIQYESVGSQVDFSEKESKIIISIIGIMDKKRYSQKKYKPKISDCNILRNILIYGKYGYGLQFLEVTKLNINNFNYKKINSFKNIHHFSTHDKYISWDYKIS